MYSIKKTRFYNIYINYGCLKKLTDNTCPCAHTRNPPMPTHIVYRKTIRQLFHCYTYMLFSNKNFQIFFYQGEPEFNDTEV